MVRYVVTKEDLLQAFTKWEVDARAGMCRTDEELDVMTIEEVATEAVDALLSYLDTGA